MIFKNTIRVSLYLLIVVVCGCRQKSSKSAVISNQGTDKLPVKSMLSDLDVLWAAIKEMHPAYGIYTPADSLQNAYDQTYSAIDQPLTQTEFINRIYLFYVN
jgi:hypothetical protein